MNDIEPIEDAPRDRYENYFPRRVEDHIAEPTERLPDAPLSSYPPKFCGTLETHWATPQAPLEAAPMHVDGGNRRNGRQMLAASENILNAAHGSIRGDGR